MDFNTEFFITLTIILSISSMFHGTIGFGFPMISTPLLAMVTDIKTAIVYVRAANRSNLRPTREKSPCTNRGGALYSIERM